MKVFLCWSGPTSRRIAEGLRSWLPDVIQALRPFMSDADTAPGEAWFENIHAELSESEFGILCVTSANLDSKWLHFEAGVLANRLTKAKVCPLLIGVQPADMSGPLVQFQAIHPTKTHIRKLLRDLNSRLPADRQVESERLDRAIDQHWPGLEQILKDASSIGEDKKAVSRPSTDMLEEILLTVRRLERVGATSVRLPANPDVLLPLLNRLSHSTWHDIPRYLEGPSYTPLYRITLGPSTSPRLHEIADMVEQTIAGEVKVVTLADGGHAVFLRTARRLSKEQVRSLFEAAGAEVLSVGRVYRPSEPQLPLGDEENPTE